MFSQLKLPTAIKVLLLKLDAESKKAFCKDAVKLLEVLVTKLQERNSLKSLIVRCCSSFSPVTKVNEKKKFQMWNLENL